MCVCVGGGGVMFVFVGVRCDIGPSGGTCQHQSANRCRRRQTEREASVLSRGEPVYRAVFRRA